jgi:CO/xanthine dehydrogenase Mo-binding subunit
MSGNAVVDACGKLRTRVHEVALSLLGEGVIFDGSKGRFVNPQTGVGAPAEEVIRECHARKVDLCATGWYVPPECSVDKRTGQGKAYYVYAFATDIAEVEVDTGTGHIDVVSVSAVHDSGKIVNPLTAVGQVEGGIAQGIGLALREKYCQTGGHVVTGDLATYLVPTAVDVCDDIQVSFVECPSRDGPFGAKGLGEPAIIPVPAAIANAVSNALGLRVTSLPISAEWVAKVSPTARPA